MVGQNIGKYRVVDRVGRGGMGTVYRAVDEMLHREVAIKVLNPELNDPEVNKRFRAEARTVARLSHPAIATIYELFEHDGQWLMVMEFVRGETLEHMVERMGPLSAQRAAELCMQALAALAHAHSMGVVHRDLKPANLMITETGAVKIMDFGIARVAGSEHLTSAGFMMGTPAYMAPEQVLGREIDARADIYAMGVVFYRLTTGHLPFKGDTPYALAQSQVNDPPTPVGLVRTDLPAWVEPVIARALAKSPDERFQSAVEFHEAFARCLAGLPLATLYSPTAPTEQLATPPRAMPTGAVTMRTPGSMPAAYTTPGAAMPPAYTTPAAAPQPPAAGPAAAGQAGAAPAAPTWKRPGVLIGALGGAVVLLLVAVVAILMFTRGGEAPPPAPDTTPADAGSPGEPPAGTVGEPPAGAGQADASLPPPAAPPPATARGGAATPARQGGESGARATTPATRPAPAPARTDPPSNPAPAAPAEEALVAFGSVKLYLVDGRRTNDQDVLVNFVGGEIAVLPKSGGAALRTLPYRQLAAATYTHARDPKWDRAFPSPPDNLDVGSFLRTGRHWLVLQTRDAFVILRLEDSNFVRILATFEERTGVKVNRITSSER